MELPKYRLHNKNIMPGMPITSMVVSWLVMDKLHADGWVYGVVFTVWAVICIGVLANWFSVKAVDIFEDKP